MKTVAVVFTAPGQVELGEIEMPAPGPDEVQIRTTHSMVSVGTEGWVFQNVFTWMPGGTPYPCVPGYQRAGVIEALGSEVSGWKVGDQVMATSGSWLGDVKPVWGSHVQLGNTRASELYRIPQGADPIDASGAVVAQVGYNAAYRADYAAGDWVVVYGDGMIGQSAAQAARSRGAKVILIGHRADRLALARQYSADEVLDSQQDDVVSRVRLITGAQYVTAVLDSVQTENAQHQYVDLLEHGRGQLVYCGFTSGKTWADMGLLQQRELTTYFISGWNRTRMEATLQLMAAGSMHLVPLVTHLMPYERAPEMYLMTLAKSMPFLGIVFKWTNA